MLLENTTVLLGGLFNLRFFTNNTLIGRGDMHVPNHNNHLANTYHSSADGLWPTSPRFNGSLISLIGICAGV